MFLFAPTAFLVYSFDLTEVASTCSFLHFFLKDLFIELFAFNQI